MGISLFIATCAVCLSLAFVACKGGDEKSGSYGAGEEGFYYCDGGDSTRYMLSLQSGKYMITAGGDTRYSGSYSYDEEAGVVSFTGDENFTATVGENALSLDMGDSGYSFKAYKYFDVTYVDENGKVIATESVLNGQSAEALEIEKDGYYFIGWYEDSANSSEFAFNTSIASDTTVYGWYIAINESAADFAVTLDYGDGTAETLTTLNGAVWTLPASHDGSDILGWWVSATNKSGELTYRYDIGDVFTSDTTLFAVYGGMGASVTSAGITWENATGSNVYVSIYDENGNTILNRASVSSSTSVYAPSAFTSLETGTYTIEAESGSTTECLTYVVNGLPRVSASSFGVIVNGSGEVISFSPVENATGYSITITDGTRTVTEDLGTRTYYNFSSWEMTKDGLTFTVTAYAEGFVSSVSDAYSYVLVLGDVKVDIAGDVVTWNRVENALEYEVVIYGEDGTQVLESFYTTDTSYSLKYYDAGTYTVSVQPKTDGYYSEAKSYDGYSKTSLAAPVITDVSNYSVSWSEVGGAVSYEVLVGGKAYTVEGSDTFVFSEIPEGLGTYEISVRALDGDGNDSPYSDAVVATEGMFSSAVRYEKNTVYWDYNINAASYVISVNGVKTPVGSGNSWEITLNKAGDNEITVAAYDGNGNSLGESQMTVYAYSVILDPNGAELDNDAAVNGVVYVAQGDTLNLGTVTEDHADFIGWYTQADYTGGQSDVYEGKGSEVVSGSVFTGSRDMYLYAYWSYGLVTISLDAGEGVLADGSGSSVGAFEVKYNSPSFTVTAATSPSQTCDFAGWYTETGLRFTYSDGTYTGEPFDGVETLHAVYWETRTYSRTRYNGDVVYSVSASDAYRYSITEMTIPEKYVSGGTEYDIIMSAGAFENCRYLVTLNIPDTVRYISVVNDGYGTGNGAFAGCDSLENVNIYSTGDSVEPTYFSEDGVLFRELTGSEDVEILYYPYARPLGAYAIPATVSNESELAYDGSPVTHDVTSVPSMVFRYRKISEITFPATITLVSGQAFYNNKELTKAYFEEGGSESLTIEDRAFRLCTSLSEVTLPSRYEDFNSDAFIDCSALVNVYIESGGVYGSEDGVLLDAVGTTLVYFPVGRDATYIVTDTLIGGNITKIADYAFAYNTSIVSVTVSASVTEIGEGAFEGCTSMKELVFGGVDYSGDLTIKTNAFYGCTALTSVELPSNLVTLEKNAFGGCDKLTYVKYDARDNGGGDTLNFASGAFGTSNSVSTLEFGKNVPYMDFASIFGGGKLAKVVIDEGNESYYSEDLGDGYSVVYDRDISKILYYPLERTGSYTVLDTTTTIASDIFSNRTGLTEIYIGKNVNSIGSNAFTGCSSLVSINVAEENTTYGSDGNGILYSLNGAGDLYRLIYCPLNVSATSVTVAQTVTSTASYAFRSNTKIKEVVFTTDKAFTLGAYSFYSCTSLEKVVLPENMTSIPDWAFYYCSSLSSVNIPSGVTSIGDRAFSTCRALTGDLTDPENGVTLPEGLRSIGSYAFNQDTKLAVTIPSTVETIGSYAFIYCWSTSAAEVPITFAKSEGEEVPLTIGEWAFADAFYATALEIPARTVSIGERAFGSYGSSHTGATLSFEDGCEIETIGDNVFNNANTVTSIAIPDSVVTIGEDAFEKCRALETVTFGENSKLETIRCEAFNYTGLKSLTVPKSVVTIEDNAFFSDESMSARLEELTFEDGGNLESIGEYAFYYSKITSLEIPASVTHIGEYAFGNCTSLEEVSFEKEGGEASGLEYIGYRCFYNCKSLVKSDLPSNLAATGGEDGRGQIFYGCSSLESVTIPKSVKTIRQMTFKNCTSLSEVIFETYDDGKCSLAEIEEQAFYGCAFDTFAFPESTAGSIALGSELFRTCSLSELTLSASVTDMGSALVGADIEKINVGDSANFAVDDTGRVLCSADFGTVIYLFTDVSGDVAIPEGVRVIGPSLFYEKTEITSVTLPASVTEIGSYAFYGCTSLEKVTLADGSGLTDIGEYAFCGCTSLESINLPEGIKAVPDHCFYDCVLSDAEIPSSVTEIGEYALSGDAAGTRITTLSLPNVESVGAYAFYKMECLVSVTLGARLVSVGSGAFRECCVLETADLAKSQITEIPQYLFYGCSSLKFFEMPGHVATVWDYAFQGCSSLEDVVFSGYLSAIRMGAFKDCGALTTCDLPSGLTLLYSSVFSGCVSIETVIFPEYLSTVDASCFEDCVSLKSVEMNAALTYIGNYAFRNCLSLETVVVGPGVATLGMGAFYGCSALTYAYTGDSVSAVESSTFYGCTALETVEFGASVTEIGSNAFTSCVALEKIIIPSSVTSIGSNAFSSTLCDVYLECSRDFASANLTGSWMGAGTRYYYSEEDPGSGNYWHYDANGEIEVW